MGVDQRERCANGLSLTDAERGAHVAMIINMIIAAPLETGSEVTGQVEYTADLPGDRGAALPYEQLASPQQIREELEENTRRALLGDGASACRVAELFEVLEDPTAAATWWRKAAELGDEDAISYVRYILT